MHHTDMLLTMSGFFLIYFVLYAFYEALEIAEERKKGEKKKENIQHNTPSSA
jgi:hypothetical protein